MQLGLSRSALPPPFLCKSEQSTIINRVHKDRSTILSKSRNFRVKILQKNSLPHTQKWPLSCALPTYVILSRGPAEKLGGGGRQEGLSPPSSPAAASPTCSHEANITGLPDREVMKTNTLVRDTATRHHHQRHAPPPSSYQNCTKTRMIKKEKELQPPPH